MVAVHPVVVPLVVAVLATVAVAAVAAALAAAVAAETAGTADLAEETAGVSGLPPPPGPAATNLRHESHTATMMPELPAKRLPQCELHHRHLVHAVQTAGFGEEQQQLD